MSSYHMEATIDKMYELIDNCKPSPLSQSKIIVPRDHILDLIEELRTNLPDEIKRYQKVISNRENIIELAKERAREIEAEAHEKAQILVNETEIMQSAYSQANELIQNASNQAEEIRKSADDYAETLRSGILTYCFDVLSQVQEVYDHAYRETQARNDSLLSSMQSNLETIAKNRQELIAQINGEGIDVSSEEEYTDEELEE